MLKDLLKKELRELCLGPKTSGALECPACDQTLVWGGVCERRRPLCSFTPWDWPFLWGPPPMTS